MAGDIFRYAGNGGRFVELAGFLCRDEDLREQVTGRPPLLKYRYLGSTDGVHIGQRIQ